eukprot:TRINITY_DN997_c0_g1_i2.p1 TRINITY_DN997_c0_g1~~TRINITY_DN997_c0_g1_i2.p1  ORF type:complete len:239 (+),score=27.44 TRINITY_DN997_c0_g1_i2:128-844(+)
MSQPIEALLKDGSGGTIVRIVCVSDTHVRHRQLLIPNGDVLIHCGDFTKHNSEKTSEDITDFNEWLGELPHQHKFVTAGNHEVTLDPRDAATTQKLLSNAVYLQDSFASVEVKGHTLKLYGTPWLPSRSITKRANAFSIPRAQAEEHYKQIPEGLDVLITHSPPLGILDEDYKETLTGAKDLLQVVKEKLPRVHVFGHNHDVSKGNVCFGTFRDREMLFVNAAQILSKTPIVIDLHLS